MRLFARIRGHARRHIDTRSAAGRSIKCVDLGDVAPTASAHNPFEPPPKPSGLLSLLAIPEVTRVTKASKGDAWYSEGDFFGWGCSICPAWGAADNELWARRFAKRHNCRG